MQHRVLRRGLFFPERRGKKKEVDLMLSVALEDNKKTAGTLLGREGEIAAVDRRSASENRYIPCCCRLFFRTPRVATVAEGAALLPEAGAAPGRVLLEACRGD